MAKDDTAHLKDWAVQSQGIPRGMAPEDDILRAVAKIDAATREAAAALPFGVEPANYLRLLETIADKVTPR